MKISNDFKKLWIDKKGMIEGMIEVEIVEILCHKKHERVRIKLHLKDNEEAKLMTWGPYELYEEDKVTLSDIKLTLGVNVERN